MSLEESESSDQARYLQHDGNEHLDSSIVRRWRGTRHREPTSQFPIRKCEPFPVPACSARGWNWWRWCVCPSADETLVTTSNMLEDLYIFGINRRMFSGIMRANSNPLHCLFETKTSQGVLTVRLLYSTQRTNRLMKPKLDKFWPCFEHIVYIAYDPRNSVLVRAKFAVVFL